MEVLAVQANFAAIDKAAGEYLAKLTRTDLSLDIRLLAEMAGLIMLRDSAVDLSGIVSGNVVLGAIADVDSSAMGRFVFGWASSNGINPREMSVDAIPVEARAYRPEVTRFEQPLYELCRENGVAREHRRFVAATTALKLVAAGKVTGLLDDRVGLGLAIYHIISGSKTAPYAPAGGPE